MRKERIQFDHAAWMLDNDLRALGPEHRGVLIDLMCLAWEGTPVGFLTTSDGASMPDESVATRIGLSLHDYQKLRDALLASNRLRRTESTPAMIFIPRMVRDAQMMSAAKESGRRGGNPAITDESKRARSVTVNALLNKCPMELLASAEFKAAAKEWFEYRHRCRLAMTAEAAARQAKILSQLSPPEAVRWIHCAIDRNWRGLYPPPSNHEARNLKAQPEGGGSWERRMKKA